MLKHSDNLIANALFKAVGQHYYGELRHGLKAIHAEKAVLQNMPVSILKNYIFTMDQASRSIISLLLDKS